MQSSSNDKISITLLGESILNQKTIFCLKSVSEENKPGIAKINLVKTTDFRVEFISEGTQKMCEPCVNAGGGSKISEAVSYETFHTCGCVLL